ncbi:MAG TPA: recombinase family protein, partial [Nitrososphaera sp.]|nr:recombinase family protein [Nitrososphaera sp.]
EFGMAQKYIDDLSRNVKIGLHTKVEKGWYPGIAPLGYLNNKHKDCGEKDLTKDPERFPLVRRMWDLMLTGLYTPEQIRELANEQWGFRTRQTRKGGGKPLAHSAIYQLFSNPFYYGWFEYPKGSGQWYHGRHEPMVTREEFERVQMLLGRGGSPRPIKHTTFAFTGLIRCGECNAMVTAEEKHQLICSSCRFKFACRNRDRCPRCQTAIETMTNPTFLDYTYYHCSKSKRPRCQQGSVEVRELERQIEQYLSRIQISEKFKEWAVKYLHELHEQEAASRDDLLHAQHKAYQDCLKRLDHLVKLKTSPTNADGSLLSDEEYGRQRSELLKEKARLEELTQDTGHRVEQWLKLAERTFEFVCSARDRFAQGDFQIKKEILATIGSNLVLKDKKLFVEAKKPFLILETSLARVGTPERAFEPENIRSVQGQKESIRSVYPLGLRELNYVRTNERKHRKPVRSVYHYFRSLRLCPCLDCEREYLLHAASLN